MSESFEWNIIWIILKNDLHSASRLFWQIYIVIRWIEVKYLKECECDWVSFTFWLRKSDVRAIVSLRMDKGSC